MPRKWMTWLSLCLLVCLLTSCATGAVTRTIAPQDIDASQYGDALSHMLPTHAIVSGRHQQRALSLLQKGYVIESFDLEAVPALERGLADYWYPHYLATVVIAVDRDRSNVSITGWTDLVGIEESVGISTTAPFLQLSMGAMAYGLDGLPLRLKGASHVLSTLQKERRLIQNSLEPPVIICFDHQAASLAAAGRKLDIIVPKEGTLTFVTGLLSKEALIFPDNWEEQLLSSGFRLTSGESEGLLADIDYERAVIVTDVDEVNHALEDVERVFRRSVLRTRLYSSADAREHQLFALFYMILVVVWTASVMRRAMHKDMRRVVFTSCLVLLSWMTVRLVKYQIIKETVMNRYMWYSYYLFQLSLPLLLLWLAWAIDKLDERPKTPLWVRLVVMLNLLMFLFVLSNDLHRLVFQLDFSLSNWATNYRYGLVFYFVTAAWVLETIVAVVLLIIKSRKTPRRRAFILPLALLGFLFLYTIGYTTRVPIAKESDYTMITGLFSLLFLEVCMRTGLIPVNTKYARLFAQSPMKMQIYDSDEMPALLSATAAPVDSSLLKEAVQAYPLPVEQHGDSLLFATKITGGYALWTEDIQGLNQLDAAIKASVERLEKANAMLTKKMAISRAIDAGKERKQLSSQLEREIDQHVTRLSSMIDALDRADDPSLQVARVAILLCYVKRKSNLFFRERETGELPPDEWSVYVDELAEIADYAGIRILINNTFTKEVPVRDATLFYDVFYTAIDWAIVGASHVMLVHFSDEDEQLQMRLLPSKDAQSFQLPKTLAQAVATAGGHFLVRDLDDATGISLSFFKAGDGDA